MKATKQSMPENMYRASRCCRVLGNPTAYLIVRSLQSARKTPAALSAELGIALTTISMTLRHLREVDLVRYVTRGHTREYWLKDGKVVNFLDTLEQWVQRMREMSG